MIAINEATHAPAESTVPSAADSPAPVAWTAQQERAFESACVAARSLDDFRGEETLVLDLTGVTPICDFFVITTGTSNRQMRAMAEEAHRVLKLHGDQRIGMEGEEMSPWILLDYGDIVVHVFSPEARKLYDLEHLWADAPQVEWKTACAAQA